MAARSVPLRRSLPYVVTAAAFIAALTLLPARPAEPLPVTCFLCGYAGLADFILNILLFAPLGAALAYAGTRPRWAVIAGGLSSVCIELAQVWIPGRDSSVGDVVSNTLGTALGVALLVTWRSWLRPTRQAARVLAGAWTILAVLTAWATVWLLQPSYPATVYYGQWTHDLGHLAWYQGRVLSAVVGALPVPDGRAADSRALRAQLRGDGPIIVQGTAGPAVPRLGELFAIYDEHRREIVFVGPDRDDLVYAFRTRAEALGFDSPQVRARGLLGGVRPGDSLRVVVSRRGHDVCLSANERRVCHLLPGPAAGWALLVSSMVSQSHAPAWLAAALDAGWLVLLTLPLGYWSWNGRALVVLGGVLLAIVLAAAGFRGTVQAFDVVYPALGLGLGVLGRLGAARIRIVKR